MNPNSDECQNEDDCETGLLHDLSDAQLFKLEKYCFMSNSVDALKLYKNLIGPVLANDAKKAASSRPVSGRNPHAVRNRRMQQTNQESIDKGFKKNAREKFSELCSDHLNDVCHRGDGCNNLHPPYKTSFIWQKKSQKKNSYVWQCFDAENNDSIEKRYCDPSANEEIMLIEGEYVKVDFEKMTMMDENQQKSSIRRLETKGRFRTNSLWYWQSDDGSWVHYNSKVNGVVSSIKSDEIDKMYISMGENEKREKIFDTNLKRGYSIQIQKTNGETLMYQESPVSKTKRQLRRRPNPRKMSILGPKTTVIGKNAAGPSADAPHNVCLSHAVYPCCNERCPMFKCTKLFLWLVQRENSRRWTQLQDATMDHLETEYMDPAITEAHFKWEDENIKVVFRNDDVRTLPGSGVFIKRLYYENECPQPWTWYWLENAARSSRCKFSAFPELLENMYPAEKELQRWKPYASVGDDNLSSDISSIQIESAYMPDRTGVKRFSTGPYTYEISFDNFEQKNLQTDKIRSIRRRPSVAKNLQRNHVLTSFVPTNWRTSQGTSKEELDGCLDPEYHVIPSYIKKELGVKDIKVWRIENHHLWKMYSTQRDILKENLGTKSINEALLFHGTSAEAAEKIIRSNFDWRLSGSNVGQVLGAGTYFSPNLKTSISYCSSSDTTKHLFIALVLCGDYTRGQRDFRRPPEKPDGKMYDSCVDDTSRPDKVAIFDQNQVYPLYLVTFVRPSPTYSAPTYSSLGTSRSQTPRATSRGTTINSYNTTSYGMSTGAASTSSSSSAYTAASSNVHSPYTTYSPPPTSQNIPSYSASSTTYGGSSSNQSTNTTYNSSNAKTEKKSCCIS